MDTDKMINEIIVAIDVESTRLSPVSQKDGNKTDSKIRRIVRADGMKIMREEIRKVNNLIMKTNNINLMHSDFEDMNIVTRKRSDCSRKMEKGVIRSDQNK